jgi:hypothetical protein
MYMINKEQIFQTTIKTFQLKPVNITIFFYFEDISKYRKKIIIILDRFSNIIYHFVEW